MGVRDYTIMKIGIIQASSQKEKNGIIEKCVYEAVDLSENEVINFGVYDNDDFECSYIETAFAISALLESKAVDFIVTGCSSGQGMMLACNSLPGVMCGYIENPSDAYLFGRINDGNAVSYPLGLGFGWAGEINLKSTLKALFHESFGCGYPEEDAERKKQDTFKLKKLNNITKRTLTDILPSVDQELIDSLKNRKHVYTYIMENGSNLELLEELRSCREQAEFRNRKKPDIKRNIKVCRNRKIHNIKK